MTRDERQFLLTAAWLFLRHGQPPRALAVCEALREDDPRDGTAAAALAQLLLQEGNPARALEVLRDADVPPRLAHASAVLETRALRTLGRGREAAARWTRYLESRKGAARQWMA
jgi:tetratricopeptide (TPR) repeat protein